MRVSKLWFTIVLLCCASASLQAQRPVPRYDFVDTRSVEIWWGAHEIPLYKERQYAEFGSTGPLGIEGCHF